MHAGSSCRLFHVAVLALALSSFMDLTHAEQWLVGGDVQKWSFLHSDDALTYFNDWANDNKTFKTGDTLLFEYDNATHSVLQLASESDFALCNLTSIVKEWYSGSDVVFIGEAGTFYYVCGAPMHCSQGMKVAITVYGAPVAAPAAPTLSSIPPPAGPDTNFAAQGAPVAVLSCACSLFFALAVFWW